MIILQQHFEFTYPAEHPWPINSMD